MPRNQNKAHCAYPGCRSWAIRGGTLCAVHAWRARGPAAPPAQLSAEPLPTEQALRTPTLEEEIALLAARRDLVDEHIRRQMSTNEDFETADALRYLAVLAQVGRSLAGMLAQRAAGSGAGELERFFAAVAQRMRELQPGND
ncbi:MAG TPA: hypothetical protein PLJ35_15195 [Anaerolineae bacterium]|nr:hypothetical protein [Anaerolineae bacterium]HPL27454.1 hypothetical protein [Anaerolineae bacterium]